jgi:hypothetical protein
MARVLGGAPLVSLDFLGLWPIRFENPDYEPWIRLDFLGFSRAKRDLSMGYERKTEKSFSCRFLPGSLTAGANATILACGR